MFFDIFSYFVRLRVTTSTNGGTRKVSTAFDLSVVWRSSWCLKKSHILTDMLSLLGVALPFLLLDALNWAEVILPRTLKCTESKESPLMFSFKPTCQTRRYGRFVCPSASECETDWQPVNVWLMTRPLFKKAAYQKTRRNSFVVKAKEIAVAHTTAVLILNSPAWIKVGR